MAPPEHAIEVRDLRKRYGSQVLRSILMVALMAVVLLLIGRIAFGVEVRAETLPGLAVYVLLGTATMCCLGIAARLAGSALPRQGPSPSSSRRPKLKLSIA